MKNIDEVIAFVNQLHESESLDSFQKNRAIQFINDAYSKTNKLPELVAPTTSNGFLLEYSSDTRRTDIRFEQNNRSNMTIFKKDGQLWYKGAAYTGALN